MMRQSTGSLLVCLMKNTTMVDMIVGCFEAATGRTFNSYCDLKQTIHGAILSHGRLMKTKGMIEANENTGKLIKGVFGND